MVIQRAVSDVERAASYAYSEIRRNGDDVDWWANRIQARINAPIRRALRPDDSFDVVGADWDTLVVLDACRYDLFEETVDTTAYDSYERVASPGSATSEWTKRAFTDTAPHGDIVYVTGNPTTSRHAPDVFHRLEEVWHDAYDPKLGSIPADAVTEAAIEAHEAYPDKRIVVHYMQPHYPFVRDPDLQFTNWGGTDLIQNENADDRARDVWQALRYGYVSYDEVWAGYRRNLEYALEHVEPLLDAIEGRVAITSDHGNLLGERSSPIPVRLYGHPVGCRHPDLVTVPWAVRTIGERRAVRVGSVESETDADPETVSDRLQALGYVE
ncbi:hypothetical protein ACFQPA_12110 [Halomarina halobia]|uniref:AlkP-core domain protein n=1 Tax=Halomarina halobia TaxID=3033386 RepID=A0ABD6AAV7_9EURY|nr:hypothetical protein [Halomarina sp. PSR21]